MPSDDSARIRQQEKTSLMRRITYGGNLPGLSEHEDLSNNILAVCFRARMLHIKLQIDWQHRWNSNADIVD